MTKNFPLACAILLSFEGIFLILLIFITNNNSLLFIQNETLVPQLSQIAYQVFHNLILLTVLSTFSLKNIFLKLAGFFIVIPRLCANLLYYFNVIHPSLLGDILMFIECFGFILYLIGLIIYFLSCKLGFFSEITAVIGTYTYCF